MLKRWIRWLFCRHKVWLAPKLSVLPELSRFPFRIQCKYCGKVKRVRGKTISGTEIYIQKPFSSLKGD